MKQDIDDILKQIDHRDGITPPEGYFEQFATQFMADLPERPELEHPEAVEEPRPTIWRRVRPYVYLAAMFAGVWCMLKMFTMITGTGTDTHVDLSSNPVIAEAVSNETFVSDYIISDINQFDLIDDIINEYDYNDSDEIDDWDLSLYDIDLDSLQ